MNRLALIQNSINLAIQTQGQTEKNLRELEALLHRAMGKVQALKYQMKQENWKTTNQPGGKI